MKQWLLWIRCAPIVLVAIFGGTALILCNPGYFWDDWVWRFQSSVDAIQIGKELGIWWGGYATNAINALAQPVLTMRIVALVAWILAGIALTRVLYRQRYISRREAFELFLLYCACHVALIRFLTSVSMYNVYIAAFWVGCAVFLNFKKENLARWWCLPLFFFSFYLNSLIVLYGLLVALLALRFVVRNTPIPELSSNTSLLDRFIRGRSIIQSVLAQVKPRLPAFAFQHAGLIALPFVFAVVKRMTTVKSQLYGNYNGIDYRLIISSIFDSIRLIRPVLRDFFAISSRAVNLSTLIGCSLFCFVLLCLTPSATARPRLQTALGQMLFGLLIFAAAVYPYILVGKPPQLTDFYEARNVLPALPGFLLILISFTNLLDLAFIRMFRWPVFGRNLLVGYLLGASVASGITTGLDLWRDFGRQTSIAYFLRSHVTDLNDVRTFVFDDSAPRISDRMIWNYEYTATLVNVFGGRDRFGISVDEYNKWPPAVPLLSNSIMKERFNFGDFDFTKPHAIITVRPGIVALDNMRVLKFVKRYWQGKLTENYIGRFVTVDMAREHVEAETRVVEIYQITAALNKYHLAHNRYPTSGYNVQNGLPTYEISPSGRIGPPVVTGDVPELFPAFMQRPEAMKPRLPGEPVYLYMSDGIDFKLEYSNAPDFAYAKQAHSALIDEGRLGYGVWTYGARNW